MSFAKRARDNFFTLNGRSSADWGIVASKDNGFDAPERDVSAIEVPGRNGELHIDNGRWRNIDVTYNDCVIERDFTERFGDFRAFCARQRGYQRLEDTFHPDEYRLADMTQGIKVSSVGTRYNSGKFDLTFNCKPQRFLKSGEEPIYIMPPLYGTSTPSLNRFTQYGATVRLLKMPASGSVSFKINYWSDIEALPSGSISIGTATAVGWEYTLDRDLPSPYWNVEATVGQDDNLDDLIFEVEGSYIWGSLANEVEHIRAYCGRKLEFENPTGFVCRPTFEVNGTIFPIHWISNEDGNGNITEKWVINCDDYSELTTDAVIDCENEYFYYTDTNGKKQNITGKMTITHYVDGEQKFPSFPKLGASKTIIYNYLTYGGYIDSFVRMYPHWFAI